MTGWELFWFAIASWLIGDGMGKLGRETAKRVRARRDMRRLAAMRFDSPRVHTGTTGRISVGVDLATDADSQMIHQLCKAKPMLSRDSLEHLTDYLEKNAVRFERVCLCFDGWEEFIAVKSPPPARITIGHLGLTLHKTDECVPDGDRLAVVFR